MPRRFKIAVLLLAVGSLTVTLTAQDQAARRESRKKAEAYCKRADARRKRRRYLVLHIMTHLSLQ